MPASLNSNRVSKIADIGKRIIDPLLSQRRRALLAVAVVAILALTLTPFGSRPPGPFSTCVACGPRGLADGILNLLLFVPLGCFLAWYSRASLASLVFGLLLSTAIELLQTIIPGRDPSLSDIIFNTAGTVVGALIGLRPRVWLVPDARNSVALTAFGVAAAALVTTITVLLLAPVQSPALPNNMQLRLSSSPRERSENMVTLRVINVPSAQEPFTIGRAGNDLVLQYPSRADAAGLDQPVYWLAHAFPDSSNADTTSVSLRRERARWYVSVAGKRATLGPTVGEGWTLLAYPDAFARRWGETLDAVWVLLLCLPIGFWARNRVSLAVAGVITLVLFWLPDITGVVSTPLIEWIGAAIGFLAGASLGWSSRRVVHGLARRNSAPGNLQQICR